MGHLSRYIKMQSQNEALCSDKSVTPCIDAMTAGEQVQFFNET